METFFIPKVSEQVFLELTYNILIIKYKNGNIYIKKCFRIILLMKMFPLF